MAGTRDCTGDEAPSNVGAVRPPPDSSSRAVVGIVSAGQLARMTLQAAIALDIEVQLLAGSDIDSAAAVARHVSTAPEFTFEAIADIASRSDAVTFDDELVAREHLVALEAAGFVLRPGADALRFGQDKLHQRRELSQRGFPVPPFLEVETADEVTAFAREHGWPLIAKAARGGFDGRGVWVLDGPADAERVVADAARAGVTLLVERSVPFVRELAVLVARRPSGDVAVYPVVETIQRDGMCHELLVPAAISPRTAARAIELGVTLAHTIGSVGILAVELFDTEDDLLVNEVALRPHNSGHWTIEGALTSQFENHLRAVLDWPLGAPEAVAPAIATVNVVGGDAARSPHEALSQALEVPGVSVHLYGKSPRAKRKLGHVTALGTDLDEVRGRARRAAALLNFEELDGTA